METKKVTDALRRRINATYKMVVDGEGISRHLVGVLGAIDYCGEEKFVSLYERAERAAKDVYVTRPIHGTSLTFYAY